MPKLKCYVYFRRQVEPQGPWTSCYAQNWMHFVQVDLRFASINEPDYSVYVRLAGFYIATVGIQLYIETWYIATVGIEMRSKTWNIDTKMQ